jgi:hypothetical protein
MDSAFQDTAEDADQYSNLVSMAKEPKRFRILSLDGGPRIEISVHEDFVRSFSLVFEYIGASSVQVGEGLAIAAEPQGLINIIRHSRSSCVDRLKFASILTEERRGFAN